MVLDCPICDGVVRPFKLSTGKIVFMCYECLLGCLAQDTPMMHTIQIAKIIEVDRRVFNDATSFWMNKEDINAMIDEYYKNGIDVGELLGILNVFF